MDKYELCGERRELDLFYSLKGNCTLSEIERGDRVRWVKKKKKESRSAAHLHLNIEDTDTALVGDILHGILRRPVAIGRELCVLDEGVLGDEVQECLARHKVVVGAVGFALARWAGSVFLGLGGQHGILHTIVSCGAV